jgi:hypothetical protein
MFAILLQSCEGVTPLPSGVRRIAQYSRQCPDDDVMLVEVRDNQRSALREMRQKGAVMAMVAGNMKQGFDLARTMIEGATRATSCCRRRSESR